MVATLINGRALADEVLTGLGVQIAALGTPLHLAAVCVGDDPGLRSFVRIKQKAAQSIGVQFSAYFFEESDEVGARQTLEFLAGDESVQGIFIELPLPASWNSKEVVALIPPAKDVDVLTQSMLTAFESGVEKQLIPPAVRALQYALESLEISTRGIRAAVIGAGALVGRPVAKWLAREGAVVDVVDIDTPSPAEKSRNADIVIAATGTPGLVTGEWIRDGATVIDYGYGKKGDLRLGDIDAESVQKKAGFLTPVPGGMGPLVVAAVLENLLTLSVRPS